MTRRALSTPRGFLSQPYDFDASLVSTTRFEDTSMQLPECGCVAPDPGVESPATANISQPMS